MKKIYAWVIAFLLLQSLAHAAAPTVPASNANSTNVEGNGFQLSFIRGNGAYRIIVAKESSEVTGIPANGTEYTFNTTFGTPEAAFTVTGEYVVYRGASNSVIINGLKKNTAYFLKIYEYNGNGTGIEYLSTGLATTASTHASPTTPPSGLVFSAVAGNRLQLSWSNGNGGRRLVLARKSQAITAVPQDFQNYVASAYFGDGSELEPGTFVVYKGTTSNASIQQLEPGTEYHFAVFEFNGVNAPVFGTTAATASISTHTGPTTASSSGNILNIEGERLTLSFTPGNGEHQLIIARKDAPVTAVPVNGTNYTFSTEWGDGYEIAPGEFVVNSISNFRTFTGLSPASTYHFRVYDFDMDEAGNTYYLTSSFLATSGSTASAPTITASNIRFENITGSNATLRFDRGNGRYALVLMKEGSAVDAVPVDLTRYYGSTVFGNGSQLSTGNYALHAGTNGTSVNITNLSPGHTYHVALFEFNGSSYPVYLSAPARATLVIPDQPGNAASAFMVSGVEGTEFRIGWTNGDGARRIVLARKTNAATAIPADGTSYVASADFGMGQEIEPGQFVVYNGTGNSVLVKNLDPSSTYHFSVYEYNSTAGSPDYLTSSYLAGNGNTAEPPTEKTTAITAGNVQANQATIGFTPGNGNGRIFILKEGSAVNATPVDLENYSYSYAFGNMELSTDNFIVAKRSNATNFTVTNLQPGTTYHLAVYEYAGIVIPVYAQEPARYSFTTASIGTLPPTVSASLPVLEQVDGNKLTLKWTSGNGTRRIVVARKETATAFIPQDAATYTASPVFGTGTPVETGEYLVYNGEGSTVTVTGLEPATEYHFSIIEYNGTGTDTRYFTSGQLRHNGYSAIQPITVSHSVATTPSETSTQLQWTNGSGDGRLVVLKEGGAISGIPAALSLYTPNPVFGNGTQISPDAFSVFSGTGSQVTITNLKPNTIYHYSIFEYNGKDAPVYNTNAPATGSFTTTGTLPLLWLDFSARRYPGKIQLNWTTAEETNTAWFEVERSLRNGAFHTIARVEAANTPGTQSYTYADMLPPNGDISYRIRQSDQDGKYTWSKIVHVENAGGHASIQLYPNPVTDACIVEWSDIIEEATFALFNQEGKIAKKGIIRNGGKVSMANLPAGIYHLKIVAQAKSFSTTILKK